MGRLKDLFAIVGASSLLFGADAISTESRTEDNRSRTATSLVESERSARYVRHYQGAGHFATMPSLTYPTVTWERVEQQTSLRTFYVPTQALTIKIPLQPGEYNGHGMQFTIPVATDHAMIRVMARYDFEGNGKTDRMEMYYPSVVDKLSVLTHTAGMEDNRSYGHFPTHVNHNASVTLLVWIPEGIDLATLMTGQAFVKAPFTGNAEVRLSQVGDDDIATVVPASSGLATLALTGTGNGMAAAPMNHLVGTSTPWLDQSGQKPPESDFSATL